MIDVCSGWQAHFWLIFLSRRLVSMGIVQPFSTICFFHPFLQQPSLNVPNYSKFRLDVPPYIRSKRCSVFAVSYSVS